MKRLTCEMCGSNDLVKDGGVFVCQSCGCKYTVEEARRMMVEGTVEVTGTVKVDNSAAVENYLKMAKNAMEASNNEEAENYANKIIELDPQNYAAWEIKGEAAGWQSKTNNNRIGEAITAWINAIAFAPESERSELRERIASAYTNLFVAMITLRCDNFARIQDKERLEGLTKDLKNGVEWMNTLTAKAGVSFNRIPTYNMLAKKLNSAACDGYKDAKKDFGPAHSDMSKWKWERFTGNCDNCIKVLEQARLFCHDADMGKTICDNMVHIGEDARDSCSWKFNVHSWNADNYDRDYSFTDEAKKSRTNNIDGYKKNKAFFEKDSLKEVLGEIQGSRVTEEIERGKELYWQEHAEEKQKLEEEQTRLEKHMEAARKKMNTLPISAQIAQTDAKIADLKEKQKGLGMFKGKEKKALQDQIDELMKVRNSQSAEEAKLKEKVAEILNGDSTRVGQIKEEFEKERGRVPADSKKCGMESVLVDGKFTFTTNSLAEHLKNILPPIYKFLEVKESDSSIKDFGKQWEICFERTDLDEKNKAFGINLYCAAESADSPVDALIIEGMSPKQCAEKVNNDWGIVGGYIFMSLFPELSQSEAEELVLKQRFSDSRTLWLRGDIRYEIASAEQNFFGLISFNKEMLVIRPND